jgi:hypothetical protein
LGAAGNASKKVTIQSAADTDPVLRDRLANNRSNKFDRYHPVKETQPEEVIVHFDGWTPSPDLLVALRKLGAHYDAAVATANRGANAAAVGGNKKSTTSAPAVAAAAAGSAVNLTNEILRQFNQVVVNSVSSDRAVLKQMSLEIEKLSSELALTRLGVGPNAHTEPVDDVTSTVEAVSKAVHGREQSDKGETEGDATMTVDEELVADQRKRSKLRAGRRRGSGSPKEYTWESLLYSFIGGVLVMLLCSALVQLRYSNLTLPELIPRSRPPVNRTSQSRSIPPGGLPPTANGLL